MCRHLLSSKVPGKLEGLSIIILDYHLPARKYLADIIMSHVVFG